MNSIRILRALLLAASLVSVMSDEAMGLEPSEIVVVANRRCAEGIELARYYSRRRKIPQSNLLLLDAPTAEACSRGTYEQEIAAPVREYLAAVQPARRVRCLVLVYGIPLRIKPAVKAQT